MTITEQPDVIFQVESQYRNSGFTVARLLSSQFYVEEDLPIQDLVTLFNEKGSEVNAVGVVSGENEFKGIIIRKELMKLISRPFGIDVLKKKPVSKVTISPGIFHLKTALQTVSEELKHDMKLQKESFYAVLDNHDRFAGIFSTRDLLIHMSDQNRMDMNLARDVQNSMVKNRHNVLAFGLEVASSFTPAQGVGGDFYLTRKISGSEWVIILCDVSGKGVAASIVTAMLYGITRTYDFGKGIKTFVRDLNEMIFDTFRGDRFLTGIFMIFNEDTGKVTILDMGHSYLNLIRNGKLVLLNSEMENLPIGITDDLTPKAGRLLLKHGDIILTVTDGLVEQKDSFGECYDISRMYDLIRLNSDCSLEEIRDTILQDFESFRQDTPYHDDMTFLLIRHPHPEEE
ncbi:CBS domain-containing protein [Oceanispirochaeta crateris]|uniref:CBS domain-containing protein n=1 Tax=Oceanispirochaeta crateris TaxID=2518645 RepID=A0A5C1QKN4_9SPIO|nr:SpoIIE family protein phosphatase [Oceanispirochaeta crateris]QEN08715.1 CBS domain-containing protein [Oceanispirochaeta crateris]